MLSLHCHPTTPRPAGHTLCVDLTFGSGGLHLRYHLRGALAQVRIPALQPAASTDGLWMHTCFEAFIGVAGATAYREFNFSPSSQWAAYAFSAYRRRVAWTASSTPSIMTLATPQQLTLEARIAATDLPTTSPDKSLQLGLTAVIELMDGCKCYWALQHPTDYPDFHHRDGFTGTCVGAAPC